MVDLSIVFRNSLPGRVPLMCPLPPYLDASENPMASGEMTFTAIAMEMILFHFASKNDSWLVVNDD